ncbi:AsmA family protein [Methyloprofundus sp.]|uniref:AsmA family protein n=1 Tax=Methyloprofundus sp. TaxID=2020875 RepID=UPI003D0989F8
MQLIYGDDKQAYRLDRLLIVVNDRQDQLQVQVAGQLNKRKLAINGNVSLLNAENAVLVFSSDSVAEFISAGETKAKFKGQASLGKTKLNSELLLFFTQGKPEIKGEIISSGLFLHDLGIFPASTVPVKQQDKLAKPRLLFSYDPIPLQGFDNLNLDLKLKISRLTAENYKLNNLVIHLLLRDKRLSLAPVSFNFSGERVQFTATIELRAKPIWTLSIVANNIPLDKLLGQKNTAHRGKVSVETKLKGVGQSMHEIASSLKGDFSVVLENETISRSELELVFLNPMGWIFSQGIFSNET